MPGRCLDSRGVHELFTIFRRASADASNLQQSEDLEVGLRGLESRDDGMQPNGTSGKEVRFATPQRKGPAPRSADMDEDSFGGELPFLKPQGTRVRVLENGDPDPAPLCPTRRFCRAGEKP